MQQLSYPKPKYQALPNESQCPTCGYFDTNHPDVRRILLSRDHRGNGLRQARCKCLLAAENEKAKDDLRRQQANLPHQTAPRRFDNWEHSESNEGGFTACQDFADGRLPFLVLCGPVDAGKSHLLEATGWHLLDHRRAVRYEYTPAFLDRLRACYDMDGEENLADLLSWYRGRVLLLDDLGVEKPSEWVQEKLTSLVDERLRDGLRTVVATNLSETETQKRLGERLASRLFGETRVVHLPRTGHRRQR